MSDPMDIRELFFFVRVGGEHAWHHRRITPNSGGSPAPGFGLTSWYTTPENVQHVAYVAHDRKVHELFYFV